MAVFLSFFHAIGKDVRGFCFVLFLKGMGTHAFLVGCRLSFFNIITSPLIAEGI